MPKLGKVKREKGLKPLPDGRCRYSYEFGGRFHRRIAGSKNEARALLEKIRTDIRAGKYSDRHEDRDVTFEKAVQKFLAWSRQNTRPQTYAEDQRMASMWLRFPQFAGKKLDEIGPDAIEEYKGFRAGQVSKKTTDNDLSRLRRLFSLCKTWRCCTGNPVKEVKFFKPESRRDGFLTPEEEQNLLEKAPEALKPCITFATNTGLRLSEMLQLKWEQVDLDRKTITVTADMAKGKRTRRVPLNALALEAIGTPPVDAKGCSLVFHVFGGKKYGDEKRGTISFSYLWKKARRVSKLRREFCWHSLRHTFASRLVQSGVDLITVKELLGHRTLDMVLRYAHLSQSHLQNAVKILETVGTNLQKTCTPPQGSAGHISP